jgi:hypothetical protein
LNLSFNMKTTFVREGGGDFSEPPSELKLLLAYEDEPTAARAKRAVDRVLSQPEVNARPELHLWKFDELADPERRERALQEAADDEVLVVSMHGQNRLVPEAEAALIHWVELKHAKPCALVISLDPDAKPLAETHPTLTGLRAAAERNDITVLLQFAEPPRLDMEAVFADIRRRADTAPPVSDELRRRIDPY